MPSSNDTPTLPYAARRILRQVQENASAETLWSRDDKLLVAVSGGPDSLCLLDIMATLAPKYRWELSVVHVNYGLRGRSADLDEQLVRERAEHYYLPCSVLRPKRLPQGNLEETLRNLRYAFFERRRLRDGFRSIAVAHTRDDQAETFLLRLLRGAGLDGLSSMSPRTGAVIRPLLQTSREDVLLYLAARGLAFRRDRTNTDKRFLRNRIRHELIPLLERDYQKNVRSLLAETARLISEETAILKHLPPAFPLQAAPDGFTFSRQAFLAAPEALARRELRELLARFLGHQLPTKALMCELIKTLKSPKSKPQTVSFRKLKLVTKGDRITLFRLSG